jgi:hypothetical protein
MKIALSVAVVLTMGMAAISFWGVGNSRNPDGSSSQIFIHGTPVCVTQRGGEIHAAVGACSLFRRESPHGDAEGYHGQVPVPGHPDLVLPPGHPPIGPDEGPITDRNRRTLI